MTAHYGSPVALVDANAVLTASTAGNGDPAASGPQGSAGGNDSHYGTL